MIKLDIALAVAVYLCVSIFLVFVLWIFYNFREGAMTEGTNHLQQCPYCTHVFFNYRADELIACPQCKNYIGSADQLEASHSHAAPASRK